MTKILRVINGIGGKVTFFRRTIRLDRFAKLRTGCANCGETNKHGNLYQYGAQRNEDKIDWHGNYFCSIYCYRRYHFGEK
jgi:hypothetical protein